MIKVIYRSRRVYQSKDKTARATVIYKIGEMKSSIGTSMCIIVGEKTLDVVCTFEDAIQLINKHWEQVKAEAVDRSINKELREKNLIG